MENIRFRIRNILFQDILCRPHCYIFRQALMLLCSVDFRIVPRMEKCDRF